MLRVVTASLCGLALAFGIGKFLAFNPDIHQIAFTWHTWPVSWVQAFGVGGFVVFYGLLSKVK